VIQAKFLKPVGQMTEDFQPAGSVSAQAS
jgi:hypothetical protein